MPDDLTQPTLTGTVDGAAITVRFLRESYGSITVEWTEIAVPYTPGTPRVMFGIFSGQSFHERDLRAGLMRDLELGDRAFDGEFVVNAAPEDIVRELLDAPTRAQMLATPVSIRTEEHALLVHRTGWVDDLGALLALVEFTLGFVRRIEPAAEVSAKRQQSARVGYREHKTMDEIAYERAADLAAMAGVEARRTEAKRLEAARWRWVFPAVLGAAVLVVLVAVAMVLRAS